VRHREAQLELERLVAVADLAGPQRRAVPQARLDEEAKSAEAVVRSLTLPWAALVQAVEQAATRDVALLQLQPDAESRLLRLTAEARNLEAMLQYHQRLEASAELSDVSLLNHEVLAAQPEHPVRFTLTATWETGHGRP